MTSAPPDLTSLQGALDEALAAIRQRLQAFQPQLRPREVGTVASVSTGIAPRTTSTKFSTCRGMWKPT